MTIAAGKYEPTWQSLSQYEIPQWYMDAKFGIFIHWGPYCVPAFGNEWYPRRMYLRDDPAFEHHRQTWGEHTDFGYKDFIPMLTAENFDAGGWARLFKDSGARFVMPVAEHHDGFAMYDSDLTDFCAARMGPKRDICGELADAVRELDMVFAVSSHRAEHWWYFDGGRGFPSDVQDPANEGLYGPAVEASKDKTNREEWKQKDWQPRPDAKFLEDWLARTCELVDKYQPQVVWFDWWIEQVVFEPYLQRFAAHYYNRGEEWGLGVAINHKYDSYPEGVAVFDIERGQLSDIRRFFWQNDTSVSKNSWGYIEDHDYKTAGDIIADPGRYHQQERRAAAERRSASGWDDPRNRAGDAARDRALAGGQWRGRLRHASLECLRRGTDRSARRRLHRYPSQSFHASRYPLHAKGQYALRFPAGVPARRSPDQGTGFGKRRQRAHVGLG